MNEVHLVSSKIPLTKVTIKEFKKEGAIDFCLVGRGATDFSVSERGGDRFFDGALNFSIAPLPVISVTSLTNLRHLLYAGILYTKRGLPSNE